MAAHHRNSHTWGEIQEGFSGPSMKICEPQDSLNYDRAGAHYEEHYYPEISLYPTERERVYNISIKPSMRETPNLSISVTQPDYLSDPFIWSPEDWQHNYYGSMTSESTNGLTLPGPSPDSESPYSADSGNSNNSGVFDKVAITVTKGCLLEEHPDHPDRHNISIDDMIMLLSTKPGCGGVTSHDPQAIRQQFSELLSIANHQSFASNPQARKPMKAKVSSTAGRTASKMRRKNDATFVCELCNSSFTRKNGLLNHYKAHLGIADKICRFCSQGFTTSLGRHEKNCKLKLQAGSLPRPSFIRMDPHMFGGMHA